MSNWHLQLLLFAALTVQTVLLTLFLHFSHTLCIHVLRGSPVINKEWSSVR